MCPLHEDDSQFGVSNNIPALIRVMAWRRPGDKPLSEPMVVILLTHICVTRPQWVNLDTEVISLWPGDDIWRHRSRSCNDLFPDDTESLPEPRLSAGPLRTNFSDSGMKIWWIKRNAEFRVTFVSDKVKPGRALLKTIKWTCEICSRQNMGGNVVCKITAILSRTQFVNSKILHVESLYWIANVCFKFGLLLAVRLIIEFMGERHDPI